jgi:putative PIN family toxin of toxin-antitoxin system
MRIVVDTNVIVSALVFGGVPRRVFEAIEEGICEWFYSVEIEAETRRVLRDKFGWDERRLGGYLPALWSVGRMIAAGRQLNVVREDPADNRILECAIAADADAIVTGDGHLLKLSKYEDISILTPREFLTAIQVYVSG